MKNEINNESDVARLIGELIGTYEGVALKDSIEPEVKERFKDRANELRELKINLQPKQLLVACSPDTAFAYKTALSCVEYLIHMTPTSKERNKLTEINLQLLSFNT